MCPDSEHIQATEALEYSFLQSRCTVHDRRVQRATPGALPWKFHTGRLVLYVRRGGSLRHHTIGVAEVFIKDLVENNAGLQTTKKLILSIAPTDTYVEVGTVSVQAQIQIMGSDDNSFVEADKIRQEELESILRGDSSKAPMSFTEWWAAVRPFRFFRALTALALSRPLCIVHGIFRNERSPPEICSG